MVQCTLPESLEYTKTFGVEWDTDLDHFRVTVSTLPSYDTVKKREFISDVSRVFGFWLVFTMHHQYENLVSTALGNRAWLGWCSTRGRMWHWRPELCMLTKKLIPRCVLDKQIPVSSIQLHGISDASEKADAAVVYFRVEYTNECVHISLLSSKAKVAPLTKVKISWLELWCKASVSAHIILAEHLTFLYPLFTLGQTVKLCSAGSWVTPNDWKLMWAITWLTSRWLIPSVGSMLVESRTRRLCLKVECFQLNFSWSQPVVGRSRVAKATTYAMA